MQTTNRRPGIYSGYSVSSAHAAPRSAQGAALVVKLSEFTDELLTFGSFSEAIEILAAHKTILNTCRILFDSGVSRVYLAAAGADYEAALARVAEIDDIGAVISDASDESDLQSLLGSVNASSEAKRERLLFIGSAGTAAATAAADTLNHERAIVCTPAAFVSGDSQPNVLYTACAFAGAILAQPSPGFNFSAFPLSPLPDVERLPESDIQTLIERGISVFERVAGSVSCVRAVTTRTLPDLSLRPLNSILIIDDVMRSLRVGLSSLLRSLRVGAASHESIASQAAVILSAKRDEAIITSFSPPVVRAAPDDPSVCIVQLSFGVAFVVEQIFISAFIRV